MRKKIRKDSQDSRKDMGRGNMKGSRMMIRRANM